ncbi:MAG: FAD-dependent oxidoreductase [Bacilli bacterium]|nr:FAD-dependent oxidoreductase [Bacilli bacterium]MBN2696047.1 FAD-dependent oxidoreductase [Bacilli bacterium]
MLNYDVIVIGASAAGATAALTARKHYPQKSILMVRDVKNVPIPCGIPYIYGTVHDPMKNLIPVDKMMSDNNIDVAVDKVVGINRESKSVSTLSGQEMHYQKLLIATGSKPIVPPFPGVKLENVYAIYKDTDYLAKIDSQLDKTKNLVIIGCGFIGAEMAEECRKKNPELNINVVEMQDHCLKLVYDNEYCELAEKALADQNINLLLNEKVESILGDDKVKGVKLASNKELPADMVILGIGCYANTELASAAGLKIGPTKGIWVNRYMQTIDKDIYACGDCAEKVSFFDRQPSGLKLASIATMEARIAGANLFDPRRVNHGVVGCFSTSLNKKAFAAAGLTAQQATEKGYSIIVGESESVNRHPGLMPGAELLKVKLIFDAGNGVIIGGQAYGASSVGELINAISAFISKQMTAEEIATFQAGTHPALTASPIAYQLVNAAESAVIKNRNARL